jgi:glucose-1-phosphate thymidylyltransferase
VAGSVIKAPTYLSPSARVHTSIVGPNVSVADGAVIRNSIVEDAIVGEGAEVVNCLLRDSLVGDHAVVRGSFTQLNVGDSSEVRFSAIEVPSNSEGAQ